MFLSFTTEQENPLHPIRLTSFGYLHLPTGPDGSPVPPAADRIEDVRDRLRDPAAARDILGLDGLNCRVQDVVRLLESSGHASCNLRWIAIHVGTSSEQSRDRGVRDRSPADLLWWHRRSAADLQVLRG
ncbi:hypothetical protein ACFTXM_19470 [Streptomyces sp. NPDC056930]|uniref:hypothetical protein n=1 Tax=Streptomyces sp. NPDC056930 TaxID=3345967 RepID=UPI00363C9452